MRLGGGFEKGAEQLQFDRLGYRQAGREVSTEVGNRWRDR